MCEDGWSGHCCDVFDPSVFDSAVDDYLRRRLCRLPDKAIEVIAFVEKWVVNEDVKRKWVEIAKGDERRRHFDELKAELD